MPVSPKRATEKPIKRKNPTAGIHPRDMSHFHYDRTHVAVTPREVFCNPREALRHGGRMLTYSQLDAEIKAASASGTRDFELMDFLIDLRRRSEGIGSCRWGGGTVYWAHPDVVKRFCKMRSVQGVTKPETKTAKKPAKTGTKSCPKCGHSGDIAEDFGHRTIGCKTVPQSWCRSCR